MPNEERLASNFDSPGKIRSIFCSNTIRGDRPAASATAFYSCVKIYRASPTKTKAAKLTLMFLLPARGKGINGKFDGTNPYHLTEEFYASDAFKTFVPLYMQVTSDINTAKQKKGIMRSLTAWQRKPPKNLFDGVVEWLCAEDRPLYNADMHHTQFGRDLTQGAIDGTGLLRVSEEDANWAIALCKSIIGSGHKGSTDYKEVYLPSATGLTITEISDVEV
ncbi:MAG: hypothetical protein U0Y96_11080 [Candidatus Kapaibacterium sp.]